VDYFQKKRIQRYTVFRWFNAHRDAMRERQREAELAYRNREQDLRNNIGFSAWSEQKDEERRKKIESNRCTPNLT
jgi:hypothetical protein